VRREGLAEDSKEELDGDDEDDSFVFQWMQTSID
jgi:hypothetical protein